MDALWGLLSSFPTVLFAALALVCFAYWALVLSGVFELDAAHGADSVADSLWAGTKALGSAPTPAAGDGGGLVGEALAALGLSRVPVTITMTVWSLVGFFMSAATEHFLAMHLPGIVVGAVALVVASASGVGAASLAASALSSLFAEGKVEPGGASLVGRTCRITIAVDDDGGQARIDEVVVRVRSRGARIEPGVEVVILERGEDGVFVVEPFALHLPEPEAAYARLQAHAPSVTVNVMPAVTHAAFESPKENK